MHNENARAVIVSASQTRVTSMPSNLKPLSMSRGVIRLSCPPFFFFIFLLLYLPSSIFVAGKGLNSKGLMGHRLSFVGVTATELQRPRVGRKERLEGNVPPEEPEEGPRF